LFAPPRGGESRHATIEAVRPVLLGVDLHLGK
jgi:hypothetical protein